MSNCRPTDPCPEPDNLAESAWPSPTAANAVRIKCCIASDDGHIFGQCLRDQKAVKRVAVMPRQINQGMQMLWLNRQNQKAERLQPSRKKLLERQR